MRARTMYAKAFTPSYVRLVEVFVLSLMTYREEQVEQKLWKSKQYQLIVGF